MEKNYEIVLTHMLYCSHKNVEFHFSAAVWGGDRLVNSFSWVMGIALQHSLNGLLPQESNAELSALSNGGLEKRNICFHR